MRINTNVSSLTAQEAAVRTNNALSSSLEKLSSGLRINKASDDASGLAIADKLRTQGTSINQGVSNGNSAIALLQIADKSMEEQSNILNTVKAKLIQANTDTTSADGRESIRKDIAKLLEQLDNIAEQTNYNGNVLLQASSSSQAESADLSFQIGEKNTDIITNTAIRSNTAGLGSASQEVSSFDLGTIAEGEYYTITVGGSGSADASGNEITSVTISYQAATGDTAEDVHAGLTAALAASTGASALYSISAYDANNATTIEVTAANNNETLVVSAGVSSGGVAPSTVALTATFAISDFAGMTSGEDITLNIGSGTYTVSVAGSASTGVLGSGAYSGADAIALLSAQLSGTGYSIVTSGTSAYVMEDSALTANVTITASGGGAAISGNMNTGTTGVADGSPVNSLTATITTAAGTGEALAAIKNLAANGLTAELASSYQDVVDDAITDLNAYRGDIGSTQNQVESAVRNLMTQSTNIASAESIIRDVDYAKESANFNKQNIIAQAGSYAISQANTAQQNVLRLLQ